MPIAEREKSAGDESLAEDKDLAQLLKYLKQAEDSIPETTWRTESVENYAFYSGDQDTDIVLADLVAKKRAATVYNEVKPKIDMLVGMAAQTKHETTILPIGREDEPLVELMGGTLNHYQRKLKMKRRELECFDHTCKSGRSLLYFYIDKANPFKPIIKCKRIEGRNCWFDPDGQEYDMSDHRFLFVDIWLTKEEITQFWPGFDTSFAEQSGKTGNEPRFFDEAKEKYRIVEGWYYKLIEMVYFVNPMSGKVEMLIPADFDKFVQTLKDGIDLGDGKTFKYEEEVTSKKSYKKQAHYMIFSAQAKAEGGPSTHNWEGFPAVFYGAYKEYGTNVWFPPIKPMKDPQRTLNTMRRQLVYLLQTLPKGLLMHEVGSILNIDEYEKKASDPNFHLEIAKGMVEKVKFLQQPKISPIYNMFDAVCVQAIKDVSGAQDSLMGIQTTSREPGITVRARQETGIAVLYVLFDNFRESRFNTGRLTMSLIQQYVTDKEVIRIEGEKGQQLMDINSQMNPQVKGFNDITAGEFDFEVSETAETMTIRAATAQMLVDFSQNQPGIIPPNIIMDYTDLPFTAKMQVRDHWEAVQKQEKEAADREYDLRVKEIEAKNKPSNTNEK